MKILLKRLSTTRVRRVIWANGKSIYKFPKKSWKSCYKTFHFIKVKTKIVEMFKRRKNDKPSETITFLLFDKFLGEEN